jgi:hypothetical protein
VCFWDDDDPEDTGEPSWANEMMTLAEAQRNFDTFGAVHERLIYNVRPPTSVETPVDGSARVLPEVAKRKRRRAGFQK